MLTAEAVKTRALALGFDLCGIAPADSLPELTFLDEWLSRGYAGEMQYLARTARRRADVRRVLPSARSVVMVGVVYNVDRPYSVELVDPGGARIARYAWGDDYHGVIGSRLDGLASSMRETAGAGFEARTYVDTGPVQERVYAQYAGLGWIGRNTCLINPDLGSWLFLAAIICNASLAPDAPGFDRCGSCRLCLEACPTGALVEPHVLDARRCLSYLTIELRRAIPVEWRPAVGTHVFGCDICQDVCPWNQTPMTGCSRAPEWQPRPALERARVLDLWRVSDQALLAFTSGSAIERAGVRGLRRNLAVALGNAGDRSALEDLKNRADTPSITDPMVADHMAWARRRLAGVQEQP